MDTVGTVGNLPEGREGADDDEAGRDRRKLREPEGEGCVIHDQQDRASTRMCVPMEVDHVIDSEPEEEHWVYVVTIAGVVGALRKSFFLKGKGNGKGRDGGKGYAKGKGKTTKDTGKNG